MRRRLAFSAFLLFHVVGIANGLAPATPTGPATTLSVDARLVTLPVTVRDKKGKIVTGLTKADFTLAEDGRPQVIKDFALDTNLPLTLGLLVDTSGSMREQLDAERAASKSFLDQMLTRPTDKAFLLHFDREVELLEDLTPSTEKLASALTQLGPTRSQDNDQDSSGRDSSGSSGGETRPRAHGGGTTLYDAVYLGADELLRKQQGRKALVVLSDGEDRGSKETLNSAIEAAQRTETAVYAIYLKGEEPGGGPFSGGNGRGMGGGFPGGRGGGFPGGGGGYPGGRGGSQTPDEPRVDGKKIMARLASETGGRFFEAKKKDSLDQVYAAIAEELRSQYILTYTPEKLDDKGSPGDFHKIQLAAKGKDLAVQTRPGYYQR